MARIRRLCSSTFSLTNAAANLMRYIYTALAVIILGTTTSTAFATDRRIEAWGRFKAGMSEDEVKKLLGAPENSVDAKDQPETRELTYPGRIRIGNDPYNLNITFYPAAAMKTQHKSGSDG